MTVESDHCFFTYIDNEPPWVTITNCPGILDINRCDETFSFEWDMDDPSPGVDPEDLWVRVYWTETEEWYELGQGATSWAIYWDDCDFFNYYSTITVQVSDVAGDWVTSMASDDCLFDVPDPWASLAWNYIFDDCALYGDPFTVAWTMQDDCMASQDLHVEVMVNDDTYPLPDGTTEYDLVVFEPQRNSRSMCTMTATMNTGWRILSQCKYRRP